MPSYMDVAISAAREAGKYLLSHRGKISPEMIDEKAINDFVTEVDENSEKMLVDSIRSQFPNHKILAEEGTTHQSENEYRWIIDPLDGTKNFIQDIPMFSISIALEKDGEIVLGVVYNPIHDELFSAEKGKGAFCNGAAIHISQRDLGRAIIATGFPFKSKNYLPQYLLCFEDIFLRCSGMRRCGSAAIDLCYTAMGRYDGFWELGLSEWDMAAGSLLITEAGGSVTDFNGNNQYLKSGFIVAGSRTVHHQLLEIIQPHFVY